MLANSILPRDATAHDRRTSVVFPPREVLEPDHAPRGNSRPSAFPRLRARADPPWMTSSPSKSGGTRAFHVRPCGRADHQVTKMAASSNSSSPRVRESDSRCGPWPRPAVPDRAGRAALRPAFSAPDGPPPVRESDTWGEAHFVDRRTIEIGVMLCRCCGLRGSLGAANLRERALQWPP